MKERRTDDQIDTDWAVHNSADPRTSSRDQIQARLRLLADLPALRVELQAARDEAAAARKSAELNEIVAAGANREVVETQQALAAARRTLDEIRVIVNKLRDAEDNANDGEWIDDLIRLLAASSSDTETRNEQPCANHPARGGETFVGGFWLCPECEQGFKTWRETRDKETR